MTEPVQEYLPPWDDTEDGTWWATLTRAAVKDTLDAFEATWTIRPGIVTIHPRAPSSQQKLMRLLEGHKKVEMERD